MRKVFMLLVCVFCVHLSFAAEKKYPVKDIPDNLKENAVAVVRLHEHKVICEDDGYHYIEKWAITILDEGGKEYAYLYQNYDKNSRVGKISAVLYDAEGEKTRKIKSDEIYDVSAIESSSLYTDSRAKVCYPEQSLYPFTVEYEVPISYKSSLGYPTWYVLPDYNVSFQEGYYELSTRSGEEISYKVENMDIKPSIREEDDLLIYRWDLDVVPAIKYEPYSRGIADLIPCLQIKPQRFTYNGFNGKQTSWEEFGQWSYELIRDRQELSPETAAEIRELVRDCTSARQKVHKVYKYMQNRVRYVNVAEGIGGLQPIEAQRVHDVGYGDCKALSNYMKALLKVLGIESIYTKILAGSSAPEVDVDFPTQQSNHVILMVPLEEDSIWLECTDLRLPPDYMDSFTDDRTVLFVTEEGGKLGKTPSFAMEENERRNVARVKIDENLNAEIVVTRSYAGNYFGRKYSSIYNLDKEDQKRAIISSFDLSGFNLLSFDYEYNIEKEPFRVEESLIIEDDAMVVNSGDYVLLPLNIVSGKVGIPERTRNRKQGLYFRRSSVLFDTIVFKLPSNLEVYQLPEEQLVESDFGKFISSVEQTEDGLLYTRKIEYYKGEFPAERYSDYYDFCKEKSKADGQQVMLKLKQ